MAYLWRRYIPVLDAQGLPVLDEAGKPKVKPKGNWLIIDKIKVDGKWKNQSFKTKTGDHMIAQKELGKYEQRVGKSPDGRRDTPFNMFLKEMRKIQAKATVSYERRYYFMYNRFEKIFGDRLLGQFTPTFISEWQDSLFQKKLSQATVHLYMGSLRHILNVAIKRDAYAGPNPFAKIDMAKEGKPRELILTPDEQGRLLEACLISQEHGAAIPPQTLHDIIYVALRLGLRKSEILGANRFAGGVERKVGGLRVRDYDIKSKVLKFYRSKTDTMTEIDLSGFSEMAELFERRCQGKPDPNEYLFTNKGKPIFDVCKAYRLAVTNAKILKINKRTGEDMNFTFHDLRHTACVDMLAASIPLEIVARILGDDIRTIHNVYARELQQGHIKEGMKVFAQFLRENRNGAKVT